MTISPTYLELTRRDACPNGDELKYYLRWNVLMSNHLFGPSVDAVFGLTWVTGFLSMAFSDVLTPFQPCPFREII